MMLWKELFRSANKGSKVKPHDYDQIRLKQKLNSNNS